MAKSKTNNDYVYEIIRRDILNGDVFPGSWLREQDLVDRLQVSRTPIREALKRLESEGLIEIMPYRGAMVRMVRADEAREEYIIRAAMESLAVELAVQTITDEAILELQGLENEMDERLEQNDLSRYIELNSQFHLKLYSYCGSPQLVSMIDSSWKRVDLYRRFFMTHSQGISLEIANHKDLLDACRRRDGELAHKIMKDSCLQAAQWIADKIREDKHRSQSMPSP